MDGSLDTSNAPRYLDEVHEYIKRSVLLSSVSNLNNKLTSFFLSSLTRQLPFNIPFSAKAGLIEQCFEDWPLYSTTCFSTVYSAFEDVVNPLISQEFGRFGGLEERVR